MKKIINKLSITFFLSAIFAGELKLGSTIPLADIKMMDISGKMISLNDVKMENGLLVNFSCNTCPWVVAWQNRYNSLAEESNKNKISNIK